MASSQNDPSGTDGTANGINGDYEAPALTIRLHLAEISLEGTLIVNNSSDLCVHYEQSVHPVVKK